MNVATCPSLPTMHALPTAQACRQRGRRTTLARLADAYYKRACPVLGCGKLVKKAAAHERAHRLEARKSERQEGGEGRAV